MILVDTTVWVGASDKNDDFHESSRSIVDAIRLGKLPLALTTDFIIDETVTILGKRRGFGAKNAGKVGERILSSPRVFVVYIEESILGRALERYPEYLGELSLTDVVSVIVMEKYHIKEVFSHDTDFDKVKEVYRKVLPWKTPLSTERVKYQSYIDSIEYERCLGCQPTEVWQRRGKSGVKPQK